MLCVGVALSLLTTIAEHIVYKLVIPRVKEPRFKYWLHTSQVLSARTHAHAHSEANITRQSTKVLKHLQKLFLQWHIFSRQHKQPLKFPKNNRIITETQTKRFNVSMWQLMCCLFLPEITPGPEHSLHWRQTADCYQAWEEVRSMSWKAGLSTVSVQSVMNYRGLIELNMNWAQLCCDYIFCFHFKSH